jgi:hypothetical protein
LLKWVWNTTKQGDADGLQTGRGCVAGMPQESKKQRQPSNAPMRKLAACDWDIIGAG